MNNSLIIISILIQFFYIDKSFIIQSNITPELGWWIINEVEAASDWKTERKNRGIRIEDHPGMVRIRTFRIHF